jgi:signal transduction histidine kinase
MDKWILLAGIVCLLAGAGIAWAEHRRSQRTLDAIEEMLRAATEGRAIEETYDESRLSALQTKFAHYLSASAVSAQNLTATYDRIRTLIADISHQTKTPIANLLLYSELLEEEVLSESAKSNVEAMHQQTEKLRFLIDSLVKLSRLENGILKMNPRREPVQSMLQSVCEQFLPKAGAKGLTLRLLDADGTAVFDPKWTTEALCNLVDNAIKYTDHGTVTLSATAYELFLRIDVADTGIGIAEEEQAKIFSRFYRSQQVQDDEGVGIGLYLAREIAAGQGGYVKVSSAPGKGSTFSLFLPK